MFGVVDTLGLGCDPPGFVAIPWYGADRSLPSHRFVPGLFPHPAGISRGRNSRPTSEAHPPWSPDQWPALQAYLRGVDLFNRWYFWEAHEVWESLWRTQPRESEPARFIQGLIGIAAALLKFRMGQHGSARKLWLAASDRLSEFRGRTWMGLDVARFLEDVCQDATPRSSEAPPPRSQTIPMIRLVLP